MPLGKYYCDYCDKELQDTVAARKRHLQGIQHQRNRALWYDSINRGANPTANFHIGVCIRSVNTGFCPRGDSCKYLHPKQASLPPNVERQPSFTPSSSFQATSSFQGDVASRSFGLSWGDLPPSLRPPPEGGYPPLPSVDWGYSQSTDGQSGCGLF